MKAKALFVATALSGALFLHNLAYADIDMRGLTEEQKAQLALQAAQMKKQNSPFGVEPEKIKPEDVNEWVDLGKNVALAFTTVAKELGVAADEFLKSNTGKITIVLIAWKIMGKDVLGIFGGSVAWVVLATIIIWSFKYFHMKKKVKTKEGVQYIQRYEFKTSDARVTSASFHVGAFIAVTAVCMIIIF